MELLETLQAHFICTAVSCTICTALYSFPVVLCGFVQEVVACSYSSQVVPVVLQMSTATQLPADGNVCGDLQMFTETCIILCKPSYEGWDAALISCDIGSHL